MDRDEILRVLRAFEASGLEYVLIGATAMGLHGLVRATEDLDLFIRATPEKEWQAIINYLKRLPTKNAQGTTVLTLDERTNENRSVALVRSH